MHVFLFFLVFPFSFFPARVMSKLPIGDRHSSAVATALDLLHVFLHTAL